MATDLQLQANGIRFHALADGPENGPLVLLLHGFPELAHSWRSQLPALARAGYRAVAPDMRGYAATEKKGPYDLPTLAGDAAGLVHALGRKSAVIVGHDWGGATAWGTAFLHPEVVEKLVVLNCPHPAVLAQELMHNRRQLVRSWYMFFFQLPWLPEYILTRDRASAVARSLRGGSTIRGGWTREALEPYREAFSNRETAHAALGYYRAAFRSPVRTVREAKKHPIAAPTAIIWGAEDRFLGQELISPGRMAPFLAPGNRAEVKLIEGAGHFVQNEAPEKVNEALLSYLGPAQGAVSSGVSG